MEILSERDIVAKEHNLWRYDAVETR